MQYDQTQLAVLLCELLCRRSNKKRGEVENPTPFVQKIFCVRGNEKNLVTVEEPLHIHVGVVVVNTSSSHG